MAVGRLSPYQSGIFVTSLLSGTYYAALAASNPFVGDPLAAEIVGGTYTRQRFLFTGVLPNLIESGEMITFHGLPANTAIAGVMVFDAAFNGNMIAGVAYDVADFLPDGGNYPIGAGQIEVGIDLPVI